MKVSNISNSRIYSQNNNNNSTEPWVPDVIVLGPGGAKGYLELGLLLAFEQEHYYSQIGIWVGCSIGSAISLLIVCGYSVTDIINDFIDVNIINDVTDINIDNITESPGLLNIKSVENLLKLRVRQHFGMIPTLYQLYMATGKLLELITFNLDKITSVKLSKNTEPNLSCVEAVMMSMAIPVLIKPRVYKGYVYIDGAIGNPYPILDHDDGNKKILGIYIDSEYSSHSSDKNPILYFYRCAQASMKILRDNAIEAVSDNCKHIALRTPIIDTTGLTMNHNAKRSMIEHGYKTGVIFLKRIKNPEKYRLLLDDDEEIPIEDEIVDDGGILDEETNQMLDMLTNDNYIEDHHLVFNDGFEEDLFLSDLTDSDLVDISESEDTLLIPITPDIRRNMEQIYRDNRSNILRSRDN